MREFRNYIRYLGFGILLIVFTVNPILAQTIRVKAGEPVKINASEGATCTYRGVSITVQSNNGFTVIAQGNPGSSSRVSCNDGTSVRIRISDDTDNSSLLTTTPSFLPTSIPTSCASTLALKENPECAFKTINFNRVYNCNFTTGVLMRPVGSVNSDPNGSILIGSGANVVGIIETSDPDYKNWYVTSDGRYVATDVVSTTPCATRINIPPQIESCPNLETIANDLNQALLDENETSLCDYLQSIADSFWLLPFLTNNRRIINAGDFAVGLGSKDGLTSLWILWNGEWQFLYELENIVAIALDTSTLVYIIQQQDSSLYEVHLQQLLVEDSHVFLSMPKILFSDDDLQEEGLGIVPDQIDFDSSNNRVLLTLQGEDSGFGVFQISFGADNGNYIIDRISEISATLDGQSFSGVYSPGYQWLMLNSIINVDSQILFGSTTPSENALPDNLYQLRELPIDRDLCPFPNKSIFNNLLVSILILCEGLQPGNTTIVDRDVRVGFLEIKFSDEDAVGQPQAINAGPFEGHFTVFNNDNGMFYVRPNPDTGNYDTYPIHLPDDWQLTQLVWGHVDLGTEDE